MTCFPTTSFSIFLTASFPIPDILKVKTLVQISLTSLFLHIFIPKAILLGETSAPQLNAVLHERKQRNVYLHRCEETLHYYILLLL